MHPLGFALDVVFVFVEASFVHFVVVLVQLSRVRRFQVYIFEVAILDPVFCASHQKPLKFKVNFATLLLQLLVIFSFSLVLRPCCESWLFCSLWERVWLCVPLELEEAVRFFRLLLANVPIECPFWYVRRRFEVVFLACCIVELEELLRMNLAECGPLLVHKRGQIPHLCFWLLK